MNTPNASHPPQPYVPTKLQRGDWVYLAGPYAQVLTGLYLFKFKNLDGGQDGSLPITRSDPDQAYFQVHDSFKGNYGVFGVFRDSSGNVTEHSFGVTEIS